MELQAHITKYPPPMCLYRAKQSNLAFFIIALSSPPLHPAPFVCALHNFMSCHMCLRCGLMRAGGPHVACVVIDYSCSSDCPVSKCKYDSF